MIFSAVLFGIAQTLYLLYILYELKVFSNLPNHGEMLSFLAGIAMVGIILSAESFFLSLAKLGKKKKWFQLLPLVLAVIAFALFIGYLTFRFITRIYQQGISF